MPSRAERQIRALGPLGHQPIPIVDLLVVVVRRNRRRGRGALPSMRIPRARVGKVLRRHARDARRREQDVRGRDDERRAVERDGRLDLAHHRVDGRVQAQRLADDVRVQREALERVVGQRGECVLAEDGELLLVELLEDGGLGGQAQDDPGGRRRRRVLARHEQRDHHVCDFLVRHGCAVLVRRRHQVPDHVLGVLLAAGRLARLDDVHVGFGHASLGYVALAVVRQRRPRQHEVDRAEAHVEVVVHLGEAGVEAVAHLLALEGARRRVDGDFGQCRRDVDRAAWAFEGWRPLDEVHDLLLDERDV